MLKVRPFYDDGYSILTAATEIRLETYNPPAACTTDVSILSRFPHPVQHS